MNQSVADVHEGFSKPTNKASPVPRRSPPPPPSSRETTRNPSPPLVTSGAGGGGVSPGAFWSTQHAKDSAIEDSSGPKFDEDTTSHSTLRDPCGPENHCSSQNSSPPEANILTRGRRNAQVSSYKSEEVPSKDFEIRFFQEGSSRGTEKPKASKGESTSSFQNDAFNTFVAEFDTSKLSLGSNANKSTKEDELEAEIERLKEQLKQANLEKSEITSKFEKLSAICRSQRQEIQELKQAFAARTSSPNRDASKNQTATVLKSFATSQYAEKMEATIWEQRKSDSPSQDSQPWQAFPDETKQHQPLSRDATTKSVRTRNGHHNKPGTETTSSPEAWGFGTESFTATPAASSSYSRPTFGGNNTQLFGESKKIESKSTTQPAGWAGF